MIQPVRYMVIVDYAGEAVDSWLDGVDLDEHV